MDLIIKVYNQYFRNVDSQHWKCVGYVVPTQYIVITSTVRWQSEVGIQRCIDVDPIVNFCLGNVDWFIKMVWLNILNDLIYEKLFFSLELIARAEFCAWANPGHCYIFRPFFWIFVCYFPSSAELKKPHRIKILIFTLLVFWFICFIIIKTYLGHHAQVSISLNKKTIIKVKKLNSNHIYGATFFNYFIELSLLKNQSESINKIANRNNK